jgi:hypothetical protein
MPAVSSCRSPNSLTCSPRERVTKLLLLSHPCFGFATEPAQPLNVAQGGHLTLCLHKPPQHTDVMKLASAADHIFNATIITVLALLLTLSAGAGLRHPAQV